MVFNCEVCDKTFTTEGGKMLHYKVAHSGPAVVKDEPKKKIDTKPKKAKQSSNLLDSEAYVKAKQEKYAAMVKKWPKKATGIGNEEKISKAKLMKLFPKETEVFVNGRLPAVPLHPKLESSYTISVREMKNEWIAVTLTGKKSKIAWKEGPLSKKYRVMIPLLQTK